jgi:hypothetical protein
MRHSTCLSDTPLGLPVHCAGGEAIGSVTESHKDGLSMRTEHDEAWCIYLIPAGWISSVSGCHVLLTKSSDEVSSCADILYASERYREPERYNHD